MIRVFVTVVLLLLVSVPSWAVVETFDDNSNYWPGWGNSSDNAKDLIGAPQLLGGSVEVQGNYLRSISIDFQSGNMSSWNQLPDLLLPGDLFLDLGDAGGWDFVAGTSQVNLENQPYDAPLYQVTGEQVSYVLSDYYLNGVGGVGDYREGHPVALDNGQGQFSSSGTVGFSGFFRPADTSEIGTMTWSFGDDIDLTGIYALTLGFAVHCANDVIFETVDLPHGQSNVVPVPASLWLLGTGVLGMITLRRKQVR